MGNFDFSLAAFGSHERYMAGELLIAWSHQNWASDADQVNDGATLEYNPSNGNVYLVDRRYNVVMLNYVGELENWLTCHDCDEEGFRSEVSLDANGLCQRCSDRIACNEACFVPEWAVA